MRSLSILLFLSISYSLFSQKGPGGISVEVPGNSDVKIWYDPSSLSLNDGDKIPFLHYMLSKSKFL